MLAQPGFRPGNAAIQVATGQTAIDRQQLGRPIIIGRRIDHRLNFRLSDLFRLGKPANEEFGPIADDGSGMRVFLRMRGTAQQPIFENDGAMAATKRRAQFQQEKQELRAILREDLLGKKPNGHLAEQQPAGTQGRITFEADSTAKPELVAVPRKGLGRLFKDEKKDEGGKVTVEE